jgi:signal peptidase I
MVPTFHENDFIIVDKEKNKEIFVGEITSTANVGNSQWQREGRKISAALKQIPMIYQTYYSLYPG